jgi:hypothetical protein
MASDVTGPRFPLSRERWEASKTYARRYKLWLGSFAQMPARRPGFLS